MFRMEEIGIENNLQSQVSTLLMIKRLMIWALKW